MASPQAHALVSAVIAEIMAHIESNPTAGDTASGIADWWLRDTRGKADPAVVETALERLVQDAVLDMRVLSSGERFYFALGPRADADDT